MAAAETIKFIEKELHAKKIQLQDNVKPDEILDNILPQIGFNLTTKDLLELKDKNKLENAIWDKSDYKDLELQKENTLVLTYNLLTSSVNFGPLFNELIQQVFALKEIDKILDENNEDNWKEYNKACSKGRTGDHNVIIYMQNNLTPILKSSTFDPSDFIAANGMVFQKAFEAACQVYGFPIESLTKQGGTENINKTTNYLSFQLRETEAMQKKVMYEDLAIKSLKEVIDLNDLVKAEAGKKEGLTKGIQSAKEGLGKIQKDLDP